MSTERTIGKFQGRAPDPSEPFAGAEDEPERFKLFQWRSERTEQEDYNAQLLKRTGVTTMETMYVANMYADEEQFYIPWSFDYRGRVYPQNIQLNPQGTDFDKSLFLFAEEGPAGRVVARRGTSHHLRKRQAHPRGRVQWVKDNEELITRVARRSDLNLSLWEEADEPWMFLLPLSSITLCDAKEQDHFTACLSPSTPPAQASNTSRP